jgi:hypothetical protein
VAGLSVFVHPDGRGALVQEFTYPVDIVLKAGGDGEESKHRIPIEIVASDPTPDRVNDSIVLKAFDDAKQDFLKAGCIDYDHQTIRGKSKQEQLEAMIGQPETLDTSTGKVIVGGYLFKGNPLVDKSIYPALRAGARTLGASVGGRILRKSLEWDDTAKRKVNRITRIALNHVAVTPAYKSVHPSTSISLAKSLDEESGLLVFDSFGDFCKSFATSDEPEDLGKTLVAGTATDYASTRGGQALQPQSIEPSPVKDTFTALLKAIKKGMVKSNYDSIVGWLVNHNISTEQAQNMAAAVAQKATKVRKVLAAK